MLTTTRPTAASEPQRRMSGTSASAIVPAVTDAAPAIDDPATQTQPSMSGSPPGGTSVTASPNRLPLPGLWVFLACLGLALLCNFASFRGKDFIGDEVNLVSDNDLLNRLPGLQSIWFGLASPSTYPLKQYAPLAQTMFFVEHALWGDTPWPYRVVSVALHAFAGLMVWRLLRSLLLPGAFAVALLFIAHPVMVDNVSWFAERRNPLAAVLSLSAVFLLLRAAGVIAPTAAKLKLLPDDPLRLYAMGALLQVLALFSSAALAATVPLVVLLIAWWKHRKTDEKLAGTCVGLLIGGVAMLSVTSSIEQTNAGVSSPAAWHRASTDAGEFVVRTQIAGRAVIFYAAKLLVPFPVAVDYPRWQTPRDIERFRAFATGRALEDPRTAEVGPNVALAYVYPALVVAGLLAVWLVHRRFGRGVVLAVAAFVLLLAPSLGFIDLGWMRYSFVSNRAMYLAAIPFLAGIVYVADRLLAMANDRTVTISTAGLAVAVFAVISGQLIATRFRDASYFWTLNASAVHSKRSWWPRYELALTIWDYLTYVDPTDRKAVDRAVQAIEEVRQYKPDEPGAIVLAGLFRQRAGDSVGALRAFEAAMQSFPNYGPAYFEAGNCFRIEADKRPTDPIPRLTAFRLFNEASRNEPRNARFHLARGRTAWEIAKRMDPDDPEVDNYFRAAGEAFDEALALRPYDVELLIPIARTLTEMGRLGAASALLEQARSISPTRSDVYEAIADASLARKDVYGADVSLRLAIDFDPKAVNARLKLGTLRQQQERWRDAKALFEAVLEIDPENAEAKRKLADNERFATTRPEATTQPDSATQPQ